MENLDKLVRFCGYGDFKNSNIIFLGNEEGLGGDEIEDAINLRITDHWNNAQFVNEVDHKKGYYIHLDKKNDAKGPFNLFCARLMIQLNEKKKDDFYFQKQSENSVAFEKIKEFKINSLFNESKNNYELSSALIDYKPLPRRTEGDNYKFYEKFDERFSSKLYSMATRLDNGADKFHKELVATRAEVLKNVLNISENVKVVIGIGAKNEKLKYFKKFFKIAQDFKGLPLAHGKVECYFGKVKINNREIPVFLSDFFQSGRGIGLKGLQKLTGKVGIELANDSVKI